MGGLLRFVTFFALLIAVLVFVVLPLALSPFLTQVVRDKGLQAERLEVSVALFDPTLLLGRSRQVTIVADNITAAPAQIAHLNVALGDAAYFDRSFETIAGEMRGVKVTIGGQDVSASTITLNGPVAATSATVRLSTDETGQLIRVAAQRAGLTLDGVRVDNDGVTVTVRGFEASARLAVRGGALLLQPALGGAVVLLQPAPSDPWSLTDAWISESGLNISGEVDFARLVRTL